MKNSPDISASKTRSSTVGSFRCGLMTALGLLMSYQGAIAQSSKPNTDNAVKSLENILQQAAEDGFLETKASKTEPPAFKTKEKRHSPDKLTKKESYQNSALAIKVDCKVTSRANILTAAKVASLDDIVTAKSNLGTSGTDGEDIDALILTYLALGLGTEAEALSERNDAPLQAAMARVINDEATAQDAKLINQFKDCDESFKIWSRAADISQKNSLNISDQTKAYKITPAELEILSQFPIHLRELIELNFAEYAAETGDIFTSETILKHYAPEIKYGELAARKDDRFLYLQALILQSKGDSRALEILTHIAASEGLYQTKAIQALSKMSTQSGLAMPASIEDELSAINDQYGDSQNGKIASLELIKFRSERGKFNDSIQTAKLTFTETDPLRLQSVTLIGDKVVEGLLSPQLTRQLYALDGYFYDPEFFRPYPKRAQLTLQAHSSARALGFPELAAKLSPRLEDYTKILTSDDLDNVNIPTTLKLAQAELALKNADFKQAIETLEPIKTAKAASALRRKASLASQDRALVQRVLSEHPSSESRDKSYLEFILQEGQWAEAKILASNMKNSASAKSISSAANEAPSSPGMPFALNAEKLNYLSAPVNKAAQSLPNSVAELEAMLDNIRNNTRVAKGLLNNAPTETYAP